MRRDNRRNNNTGEKTKNCKTCRDLHNNKNKPILKCENIPNNGGFYKQEKVEILTNDKIVVYDIDEPEEQDGNNNSEEQEETKIKVKTIKELLQDI